MKLTPICNSRLLGFFLLLTVALVASPSTSSAQLDERAAGTRYVLAFPDTTTNAFDPRFPNKMEDKILIYIYSAVDNKVTIQGNGYNRTVNPVAGKFEVVDLTDSTFMASHPIVTEVGKISSNTFRLEAQSPIVVYCYIVTKFGAEAWTPIPVDSWGSEYYAAAMPGEIGYDVSTADQNSYTATPKAFPAEITVVASEDSTVVWFTASARLLDTTWKTIVTLNANQAYQLQTYVDTSNPGGPQPDFAGAHILASKPIGVLSGNTRGMVEDNNSELVKNIYKNMMIEWLAPIEQHGTCFVYMPTLDGRQLTGAPNEDATTKRQDEWVRIYATERQPTTGYYRDPTTGSTVNFETAAPSTAGPGGFYQERIGVPTARYFKTNQPAQAFMNTTAVMQFLGTTGGGSGVKYDGYGTYSTELTPREQWVNFAPYYAPAYPASMEHFINVVTDTTSARKIYIGQQLGQPLQLFPFTKRISGTDLIWGTMSVNSGIDYYLSGWNTASGKPDTSVRFGGYMYGFFKGHEEYRSGTTRKKDNGGDGIASTGAGKSKRVLELVAYEEYLAVAYGYPLAPSRIKIHAGDSLQIDTTLSYCSGLFVKITTVNNSLLSIRSISLENPINAKLEFFDPVDPRDIPAKSKMTLFVLPIDPLKDASATLRVIDNTGRIWRIPWTYQWEHLDLTPSGNNGDDLDFGEVTLNKPSEIKTITVTNPLTIPVTIRDLKLISINHDFEIISPTIPPEITLQPGKSIQIQVRITPTVNNRLYVDSLKIVFDCSEVKIRLAATTGQPILSVDEPSSGYSLSQNDPNPFTHSTTIEFTLGHTGMTTLEVYNAAGQKVATILDGAMEAGNHKAVWDASGVAAGVYYYRLISGAWTQTRAMIVQ